MADTLLTLPVTAAYLRRIGAAPTNFRTAVIKSTVDGYPKTVGSVRFTPSGSVIAHNCPAPSPEEAQLIAAEFVGANFPTQQAILKPQNWPRGLDPKSPDVFVLHDFDGQVVMVQERKPSEEGGKDYIPWTYWSDGEWRSMEPDSGLPFWGTTKDALKASNVLFLHEGAKAARCVVEMIAGNRPADRFPWIDEMRYGVHLGWIGGVHALNRSDWEKLSAMGWSRVYIVADNDHPGRKVIPEIAKKFDCPCFAIEFTDEFPVGFDCADPFPERMYDSDRYIGMTMTAYTEPATYATDAFEVIGDNGRPRTVHRIRDSFRRQWVWVPDTEVFVNTELPRNLWKQTQFDGQVKAFSQVKTTSDLLRDSYVGATLKLTYDPAHPADRIVKMEDGTRAVNLYMPPTIRANEGDFQLWTDFLDYMFPHPGDRMEVKRWVATLMARSDVRIGYGMLVVSEVQGVGKTTLGNILQKIVGPHNTAFPSDADIVDSPFNGWLDRKRLIIVNEIYAGQSWKAYNKLKSLVTDRSLDINVKYMRQVTLPNWAHFFLCSNEKMALKLEGTDRRWLVPEVTEKLWPKDKYKELYQWLDRGGYQIILHWAQTFEKRGEGTYVSPSDHAPMSKSKMDLIIESRSEAEKLLRELAEAMLDLGRPVVIRMGAIREWLAKATGAKVYESDRKLSQILRDEGIHFTGKIVVGGRKATYITNEADMAVAPGSELTPYNTTPSSVIADVI